MGKKGPKRPRNRVFGILHKIESLVFALKKGKKEQKWVEQLDKINFIVYYSILVHLPILAIYNGYDCFLLF